VISGHAPGAYATENALDESSLAVLPSQPGGLLEQPLNRDTTTPPSLLDYCGVGLDTAATLFVTAGDNPDRLHSERSWAHLCGVCPIPAGSGKTDGRYRVNRGGDRQANAAFYRIVLTRMSSDPRPYVALRRDEGKNTAEIMRSLKRYVARDTYKHLPRTA
jgi:transposase